MMITYIQHTIGSRADSLRFVVCDSKWLSLFIMFQISIKVMYLQRSLVVTFFIMFQISIKVMYLQRSLVVTWLVPCETAATLACSLYTIQSCTMSCHFMQSHIRTVHACLTVTCHPHFWQNYWDLLCATVVHGGGTDTETRVSTESWPWNRKFSTAPVGTPIRGLLITSPAL